MRLLILGANGKTGTQLDDLALARDHEVTAFVHSPAEVMRRRRGVCQTHRSTPKSKKPRKIGQIVI